MTRSHVLPRDAAAIAGMGQTEFSRNAGRTELQLASEAIVAACTDAHIDIGEVDGLVSYTIDPVEETELVRSVGLQEIGYSARVPYGGGGSIGVLMHAAAAVASGVADVVIAYRAVRARSGASRFGRAKVGGTAGNTHAGTTAMQWCTPHGVLTPASWMALNATRYMHQYGVTSEDFGRAVVQLRSYAATNPGRVGLSAAHDACRPPSVPVDRRTLHPHVRLLSGDRRRDRVGDHERRARRRHAASAGRDRGRCRRRPVRAGNRVRPLPA